jgi:threonyl-tRNA synthetase
MPPSAETVSVQFPDGSLKSFPLNTTCLDVAQSISQGLARNAVAAEINGRTVDLDTPLAEDASLRILTFDDDKGREVFHHSSAHLLAQAVVQLFPQARPTIGPAVDEGFYYDFDHPPFTPEDLQQIEQRMVELAQQDQPVHHRVLTREEALELFKDNPYKLEMIREMPEDQALSVYGQGEFLDLCRGPHIPSTGRIKAIKVTKLAGAYWRADARNAQLQRIYAITFPDRKLLKQYLLMLEEAAKRDHRRLGKQLDLYSFQTEGPGLPFWHSNGMFIKDQVIQFWRQLHRRDGYQEISTPIMLDESLWHRSGHASYYRENMYFTSVDDRPFAIKPMNCPGGLLVYNSRRRSYRELPLRIAELGLVHRHEMSGVLHGLFRVRCFTQDDAHIYCTEEQLTQEVIGVVRLVFEIYRTFGFQNIRVELSTRPQKRIGDDSIWDRAEAALHAALNQEGVPFEVNPGDGAFYGPKIDFHIRDSMNRSWQCGTVQVDFALPSAERFNATYEGADGSRHQVVMVHRAILGSLERFIGICIEHFAGKLPLWISPRQMRVIPVSQDHQAYAQGVYQSLFDAGFQVELDDRNETMGKKVREAQLDQVNYQLVVGGQEAETGTVSVRTRGNRQLGQIPLQQFIAQCRDEIHQRTITGE